MTAAEPAAVSIEVAKTGVLQVAVGIHAVRFPLWPSVTLRPRVTSDSARRTVTFLPASEPAPDLEARNRYTFMRATPGVDKLEWEFDFLLNSMLRMDGKESTGIQATRQGPPTRPSSDCFRRVS